MVWAVLRLVPNGYFPHRAAELGFPIWDSGLVYPEASAGSQAIGSKSGFAEPPVTVAGPLAASQRPRRPALLFTGWPSRSWWSP
jgi:hypothetical protein